MKPKDIDLFFARLGNDIPFSITIILTGGGAGILEGVSRATRDLDFQIVLKKTTPESLEAFRRAIQKVEEKTRIAAQYETNIETWSSIVWPEPKPKSYRYKRFGRVEVRILDPLWWSIGKIARYLAHDVSDVVTVFKTMRVSPRRAAKAWGRALGRSPLSNAQPIFQRQAIQFFGQHARQIWGRRTDPKTLQELFLKTARQTHG